MKSHPSKPLPVDELVECVGGDRELLERMARIFLAESPKMLEKVCTAAQAGDSNQLLRSAHTIKGSVSHFGDPVSFQAALEVEEFGVSQNLNGVEKAVRRLESALEQLRRKISEHILNKVA